MTWPGRGPDTVGSHSSLLLLLLMRRCPIRAHHKSHFEPVHRLIHENGIRTLAWPKTRLNRGLGRSKPIIDKHSGAFARRRQEITPVLNRALFFALVFKAAGHAFLLVHPS